jgi:hypothetical protein
MEQSFIILVVFLCLFLLCKWLEVHYIDATERNRPLKLLVRDLLFASGSLLAATQLYFCNERAICTFFNILSQTKPDGNQMIPDVLMGDPGF